ncbi:pyrophosphatase [Brachybacterium sp. JB7]|uniref:MazG nucleotide pyrophosphohydrolase domain-containing protein n=1 Tax=Brachybacterium TaxID=43668 RepID=UPI000DF25479|nr:MULTISPECIES: MazG nucleotide pyrophosphohydrolase domain-containing protein [Brachybacterium]RCS61732.1 pyrophosphatase [Brachybacterium sp. JB7]RCS77101.1 pyrophosphatase [Brachybacterium alimentarium]
MDLHDISARIEKLSAQYAEVYGIERSAEWALLKLAEEVGELAQAHLTATGQSRDRGLDADAQQQVLADELGDVLGMCLVYAQQMGIDPVDAVTTKWFQHERSQSIAAGTEAEAATESDADTDAGAGAGAGAAAGAGPGTGAGRSARTRGADA